VGSLVRLPERWCWNAVYELAYVRWRKPVYGCALRLGPRTSLPALLYGNENLPDGDPIPKTSVNYGKAGFAALRSPNVTAAVRFGLHGGGHGHPDMLNLVTFAYGTLFGVDPGSIGYGAPLHREWYRGTIAHNTVCVDRQLQSSADGHEIAWEQDAVRTLWKAAANVYPGVELRRELTLKGDRITDRFICESQSEHLYDWAFHSAGMLTVSIATALRQDPIGHDNGYQHIKALREGATDKDWSARWVQGSTALTLHIKGEPGTVVITGAGPGRFHASASR
jgi:hypothetical protein